MRPLETRRKLLKHRMKPDRRRDFGVPDCDMADMSDRKRLRCAISSRIPPRSLADMSARADGTTMVRKKSAQQKTVTRKLAKPARWTVRGVAPELQKRAGDLARAEGLPVGVWLSALIDRAARADAGAGTVPTDWRSAIEARIDRLEQRAGLAAGDRDSEAEGDDEEQDDTGLAPARDGRGRHLRERGIEGSTATVVPERVD